MKAMILAEGKGSRVHPLLPDIFPEEMVVVKKYGVNRGGEMSLSVTKGKSREWCEVRHRLLETTFRPRGKAASTNAENSANMVSAMNQIDDPVSGV